MLSLRRQGFNPKCEVAIVSQVLSVLYGGAEQSDEEVPDSEEPWVDYEPEIVRPAGD